MTKENKFLHNLFTETLYSSSRYTVKGNIGYSITIEDKHDKQIYRISYNELAKFRKNWETLAHNFKERFLAMVCAAKS